MHVQQKGMYLTIELLLVFIVMISLAASSVYLGMTTMNAYRADQIRSEAEAVDHALHIYSLSHKGLDFDDATIDSEKNVKNIAKKPVYPESLSELGIVQVKFGYISNFIEFTENIAPDSPGKFAYTPILDEDGHYSSYILKAYLPNGYLYQSSGSAKTK